MLGSAAPLLTEVSTRDAVLLVDMTGWATQIAERALAMALQLDSLVVLVASSELCSPYSVIFL